MEKNYLNFGKKVAYGFGDMGSNFMYTMVNSFFILYLTNAVGLNAGIIGTLMMVSKFFDGASDLFFGSLIDRTHTKWGKARPWMLLSILPLALCEILLFSVPSMSVTLQYAYIFILYTLINAVCYTVNNIAYSTMSALITKNSNERVQLGSIRFIMALCSSLFVSTYTVDMVEHFGNGLGAWRTVAVIYALALIVCMIICVMFSKEVSDETNLAENKTKEKTSIWKDFKLLLTNKFYVRILGFNFVRYFGSGIAGGVIVFFALYSLGNAKLLGIMSASSRIPVMICLSVTPFLVKKFGVYKVNLFGRLCGLAFTIGSAIFGYMGSFMGLVVCTICSSFLSNSMTGTLNSVVADAAHYTYLKDRRHIEGAMFSCTSIGVKVGSGLGTAICGWLLTLGGYSGAAEVQSASAISMINFMYLIIPVILQLLMFLLAAGLNVEKANKELEAKNTEQIEN